MTNMNVVAVVTFECVECGDQWDAELHIRPMPSMEGVIRESVCQSCTHKKLDGNDRRREEGRY